MNNDKEKLINLINQIGTILNNLDNNSENQGKIKKLNDLLIYTNDLIEIMDKNENITIEEAKKIKNEKEKIISSGTEKAKVRVKTNPNAPSTLPKDNDFYLGFIITAFACSLLMGAYIHILF